MKKVVFIVNSLQNGGAERVVINQANYFARTGEYEPVIICFRKWNQYNIDKKVIVKYLTDKMHFSKIQKILYAFKLRRKLDHEIKHIGIENIYLMTAHLPLVHFICRFSKFRSRILFVMHNPHFQFRHSQSYFFKKAMKFLYSKLKLVCVSNGIKKELIEEYGISSHNVAVIYNPVDFEQIDDQLKIDSNVCGKYKKYILFCGRLTKQKRPDRMISTFYKSGLFNKYNLVFIGVGEKRNELRKMTKTLNLENRVHFLGWQKNAYVWMKNASVMVCTSDYESFGMVLVEALYCGCPVVSTNCKYGPDEILINDLSRFLTSFDENEIGNAVTEAIDCYPRPDKAMFNSFEVGRINNEYIRIYGKLVL